MFYKCHYGITPSTAYGRTYLCYVCGPIAICSPLLMGMWVCRCTPLLMDLAVITNKASMTTHPYTSKQSMSSAVPGVWGNPGPIADSNFPKASCPFVLMQVTIESYSFLLTSEPLLESHPNNTWALITQESKAHILELYLPQALEKHRSEVTQSPAQGTHSGFYQ